MLFYFVWDSLPQKSIDQLSLTCAQNLTMSTTTVTHSTVQDVLSDYTIRLTGDNPASQTPQTTTNYSNTNPPDWPSDRRRVPDYQPIDRNRGPEERPNGDNAGERIFLSLMFTGVVLNAVSLYFSLLEVYPRLILFVAECCQSLGSDRRTIFPESIQICDWRRMVVPQI